MDGVSMAGFSAQMALPVDLQALPHPAVTVAINFRGGLLVDASGRQNMDSVVASLAPGDVRVRGEDIDTLQIRLSPLVAHAVLGGSAELGGELATLDDLWGRDAKRVQGRLRAAGSWEERFAIAQAALARRCEQGPAVDPEVAYAWRQMVASRGQIGIDRLAMQAGWSRKRLWSRFRSQIGLGPKRATQLVRFDYAAHRLAAGQSASLVAAESGFADQSHLNRDVMAFAGATPTDVAAAPWLAVDDIAWARSASWRR